MSLNEKQEMFKYFFSNKNSFDFTSQLVKETKKQLIELNRLVSLLPNVNFNLNQFFFHSNSKLNKCKSFQRGSIDWKKINLLKNLVMY
jgi:hypothetical protein